jgi:hypothetical protein
VAYHTPSGPKVGPITKADRHRAISVIADPEQPWTAVGFALPVGPPGDGVEVWRLILDGEEAPGRWIVLDREFIPVR